MAKKLTRRVWEGIGLIFLGLAIGFFTFVTVVGPIAGIGLMVLGVFLIVWTVLREGRAKRG